MTDLNMAPAEAVKLNRSITQFLKFTTCTDYDDLSGLDIDFSDGEQLLLWEELRRITDKLADMQEYISYLTRPITEVSLLRKGTAGKYRTANEGRTVGLYTKVSPEEKEVIDRKMALLGTTNLRAYLRKMAVDGYVVQLDMSSVAELVKRLRSISSNVNQIARRCNSTRILYAQDVEDLRQGYTEVWQGISVTC
jgi:hypothetical protein